MSVSTSTGTPSSPERAKLMTLDNIHPPPLGFPPFVLFSPRSFSNSFQSIVFLSENAASTAFSRHPLVAEVCLLPKPACCRSPFVAEARLLPKSACCRSLPVADVSRHGHAFYAWQGQANIPETAKSIAICAIFFKKRCKNTAHTRARIFSVSVKFTVCRSRCSKTSSNRSRSSPQAERSGC